MNIKPKTGPCLDCTDGKDKPLISGRCGKHYWKYRQSLKPHPDLKPRGITAIKGDSPKVADIQKYNDRSVSWLLKKATAVFNKYIRERDRNGDQFTCISCGQPKGLDQIQAGHYLSAGHNGVVRFNEDNVHAQCIRCNMYLSGNQIQYRQRLIKKIGIKRVELLERLAQQSGHKWNKFGIIHCIETYKQKIKDL